MKIDKRGILFQLLLSHGVVILSALLVVGISLFFVLNSYQQRLAASRLADIASTVAFNAGRLAAASPDQTASRLKSNAEQLGIGIIFLSRDGRIVFNTGGSFSIKEDHSLKRTAEAIIRDIKNPLKVTKGRVKVRGKINIIYAAAPVKQLINAETINNSKYQRVAAVVVVRRNPGPTAVWKDLGSPLAIAFGAGLLVAVLLGMLFSRGVYKPLNRLARAMEAVRQGDYSKRISEEGPMEIAEVAGTFNQMATEVERSRNIIKNFIHDISHELRTPLTTVSGFINAILDGTVTGPEEKRRRLESTGKQVARIQRLVSRLLDISRIEAGKLYLDRRPVNIAELAQQCIDIFKERAEKNRISLTYSGPDSLYVMGDIDGLEQVFFNLLDNAFKYTPVKGSIAIKLETRNNRVILNVEDTGAGISPENLGKVFNRLHKDKNSRGSGLGLAIVNQIIASHEGLITVDSQLSKGTRFEIILSQANSTGA